MTEFLKIVANHYLQEIYDKNHGRLDPTGLSRYLFVYPNHRSALFMGHYLSQLIQEREGKGCPVMAPRITTISEIYSLLSNRKQEDQMSLLFRLFGIFNRRFKEAGGQPETFDKFIFWGQMLLSDFNDIDKYSVALTPAMHQKLVKTIYSVVTDHKEVDVTFDGLDEHLAEVLAEFWTNIKPETLTHANETKEEKESFLRTWRILYDVYMDFNRELEAEGLTYEGMRQREVVDRVTSSEEESRAALEKLGVDRVVFVCLTAITKVDERLLDWLMREQKAEFCWDWADPRLRPQKLQSRQLPTSHAAFFPSHYTRFPNALSEEELYDSLVPDNQRQVTLIEVPSGVGQADEASRQLQQWHEDGSIDNPLHTAVVLPDENLLFPMLYQIPQIFDKCNVTMGYTLKQSPTSALVDCLAALQFDARFQAGEILLNYKSVLALLSHGYLSRLESDNSRKLINQIHKDSIYEVPVSMLRGEVLDHFLIVDRDPLVVAQRLKSLMEYLLSIDDNREEEDADQEEGYEEPKMVFEGYEREFIYNYLLCIERLEELLNAYPEVKANAKGYTFYLLLQRLVSGVQVPFSGEPLDGLQVMGVLETRSLDFENLVILSMNEGVYPAKQQQNTFIPLALREAFGLPSQSHRDSVYAYHFYRMLSRARRVTLIYDSRTEGGSTGEVSRYVLQLKYLCPEVNFAERTAKTKVVRHDPRPIMAPRNTEQVKEALAEFLQGGTRKLSATAIKDYLSCPLRFYLKVVRRLYQQDDVKEGVDGSIFGLIVHEALESLFKPEKGVHKLIGANMLGQWIKDARSHRFNSEVGKAVNAAFDNVTHGKEIVSYLRIAAEGALDFVIRSLEYDRDHVAPFEIVGTEWKQQLLYPVTRPDGSTFVVQMEGIYDRLDIAGHIDPETNTKTSVLRIVDYKTESGDSKMNFASPEILLTPKGSKVAFQVMLYSLLLDHATREQWAEIGIDIDNKPFDTVSPHLYFMRSMGDEKYATVLAQSARGVKRQEVWDVEKFRPAFEKAFQQTLNEIFDTDNAQTYYRQTDDTDNCKYCQFKDLCRKS